MARKRLRTVTLSVCLLSLGAYALRQRQVLREWWEILRLAHRLRKGYRKTRGKRLSLWTAGMTTDPMILSPGDHRISEAASLDRLGEILIVIDRAQQTIRESQAIIRGYGGRRG